MWGPYVDEPAEPLLSSPRWPSTPASRQRVRFDIPAGRLGFSGRDGRFVVEPGAMTFLAGASRADVRARMTVDLTGADDHPDPNTVAPCRHLIEGA
jgi:hypothetical protein